MKPQAQSAHAQPLDDGRIFFSLWVLISSAAAAQASVESMLDNGLLSTLLWTTLYAWGIRTSHLSDVRGTAQQKQWSDLAGAAGLSAFLFGALLLQNVLSALIVLLLWLQLALALRMGGKRDAYFSIATSFVLLLFGSANSKSELFLLFIAVYSLACVYALIQLYAMACRNRATGNAVLRHPIPIDGLALTAGILAIAAAVYLFMPRPPAAHVGAFMVHGGTDYSDRDWQREAKTGETDEQGDQESNKSSAGNPGGERPIETAGNKDRATPRPASDFDYQGFDESFDITSPGAGRQSNAIALYVQALGPLYLTGRVFDKFDGLSWSASDQADTKHLLEGGRLQLLPTRSQTGIQQIIEVAIPLQQTLFAASQVASLGFPGPVVAEDSYGALRAPKRLQPGTVYQVESMWHSDLGRPAHRSGEPGSIEPYLQLPQRHDPAITELAQRVAGDTEQPLQQAIALEQHLRSEYAYSFESVFTSQNRTPLTEFLFQTRRGHCEYFASAMAIMLRTLDIPARLVTGFSATNYNPMTGYYEARLLDGHAWVEAWLPPHGWVLFEPTAFYPLPANNTEEPSTADALDRYIQELARVAEMTEPDTLHSDWLQAVKRAVTFIRQVFNRLLTGLIDGLSEIARRWGSGIVLATLALALVGFVLHRLRRPLLDLAGHYKIKRARRRDSGTLIRICYLEAEKWLQRRGVGRDTSSTVEEYAQQVGAQEPLHGEPLNALARLFIQARYSKHALAAEQAQDSYRAFLALTESKRASSQ